MHKPSVEFKDKVVVVTGAASGIGLELARQWVMLGARVAMLDVDKEGLARLADRMPGRRVLSIVCDIRSSDACQAAVARVIEQWGRIDVLANNAGISHHSELRHTDLDVLRRVMDVNFFGTLQLTHAALPELIKNQGRIVVLSSVAGFAPLIGRTGYAASKHALHGLFDTLRAELRDENVSVTMACPSFTKTAIDTNALSGDGSSLRGGKKVVGKLLRAEDVAQQIIDSCTRRQDQVLISPLAKASYWLSRLVPPVYERVMRRSTSPAAS